MEVIIVKEAFVAFVVICGTTFLRKNVYCIGENLISSSWRSQPTRKKLTNWMMKPQRSGLTKNDLRIS